MLLSKLSLPGIFFNKVTEKLILNKSTYDENKLLKEMTENNQCTILNASVDSKKLNENLKSSPLIVENINISEIHLYFNNSLDSSITIENITIDLVKNNNIQNNDDLSSKEKGNDLNFFGMESLCDMLRNLLIIVKNIKVRIKEKNNFLYSLLINEISYQKNLNKDKINEKEKLNFLFCHNKYITIGGIILKEGFNENDEIYFNTDEKCNKVDFYTNPNILFVIYNKIKVDIIHDNKEQKLLINNSNYDNLFIECIMNITQIRNLIKFNNNYLIHESIKINLNENKNEMINNDKDKNEFDFFNFIINKFEININFNYCYFIFLNTEQNIDKFWMFYQKYFDKYYTMNIDQKKSSDISKKINTNDNKIINLIQKHFCYFGKEYYFIYVSQPKFFINNDCINNKFLATATYFLLRLIQPNKISEKINVIIIDNKSNNNGEHIDEEQTFHNLFLPYYKQVIQFGFYIHNISIISNLEIGNIEITFDETDIEMDSFVIYNITYFYKLLNNLSNEQVNKNINEVKVAENNEFNYNYYIKGNRINLNLMINKKWIDYLKEKKLVNNSFDSYYYSEKMYISLETIKFNINENNQKKLYNFCYNKLYFFFIMKNILYPLFYIFDNKKVYNSNKQVNNSIIISKINNTNIDANSFNKYIFNFDKIYLFFNPMLLNYYVIEYWKILLYTFDIFKQNKNKTKYRKSLYNIEENLNIDLISAEYERNKFNNKLLKIIFENIKNIEINMEDINFVFFCNLSTSNNKFDIKNILEKNENLFKIILNPIIILKLQEYSFKNNRIKLNNIILLVKKKNENFNREELIYKEIMGNIDFNNDNYEFIIYKSKTQSNILKGEIKIEEKKGNIKLEINAEDIVFCPISKGFNDIVSNIDKGVIKYSQMNSFLFSNYPFINGKTDLINYEKIIKNKHIYTGNSQNKDFKFKVIIKCSKLFLDLYSTNKNRIIYDRNLFENIIEKNKMRFILELEQLSLEYIHQHKINLSLQKLNSAFLKDLRISHSSCSLLIDDFAIINYEKINTDYNSSNNFLVEINNENKNGHINNKINNEIKHESIIANIGFVPIIESQKGISININLNENNKMFNNIIINTNNELLINDINFKLCKDSLKDIIYFLKKMPNDVQLLLNLKSAFKDDVEKILIDKDNRSINYLKDQLYNKDNDTGSLVEFHSVKSNHKEQKNNKMYNRLLKHDNHNYDYDSINSNISNYHEEESNIIISNYMISEEVYKNKNIKKNYKMNLRIKAINIYLYDGEDFNFQGNHMLVVFYNSSITGENKSTQENISKTNERNINKNILISMKDLKCIFSRKNEEINMNIILKALIIEDNIEKSIYKKLLSHFDFQNDKITFLNSDIKISNDTNGNRLNNIKAKFEISPMAIYLDQITFDFIINFFNVLKFIIKNEDENEDDDLNTNESNQRINNRIIHNNDDIMNINNNENDFNSNDEQNNDQEISTINHFQSENTFKTFLNMEKLYLNNLVINPFFISFNYNPREENSSEEEEDNSNERNNEKSLLYIKILEYLKQISLNEFILDFKKYENHANKPIKINHIFKNLFDYYYNDIVDYKSFNNYVKALPVVNKFCSVYEGFFSVYDKTVNHKKNNVSLQEGFVSGTEDLVINTTCSILSMGESIANFLGNAFNLNKNANFNKDIIKKMKKKINENLSKKEEYYFK